MQGDCRVASAEMKAVICRSLLSVSNSSEVHSAGDQLGSLGPPLPGKQCALRSIGRLPQG
eukprot:1514060-Rhodomonas_salina.2